MPVRDAHTLPVSPLPPSLLSLALFSRAPPPPSPSRSPTSSLTWPYYVVLQLLNGVSNEYAWKEGSSYSNSPLPVSLSSSSSLPLLLGLTPRPWSGSAGAGGRQRNGVIGLQMVETRVSLALWGSVSVF
ncbi:hypothetical protein QQF64_003224 [Cirrhinus molitorella]|uniref:Uncharacterized protein n=1 Tax=Cirrhinus molitorella TaxID=172907 RepID=A0ABR3MKW3_9TELE